MEKAAGRCLCAMTDIGNQAAPWMDIEEFTLAARGMVFSGLACGPKEGETVLLLHGFPQFADGWVKGRCHVVRGLTVDG